MGSEELIAVAGELYALVPGEFVAARNERAARIKTDGDAELARAVKALPKPAAAAWLANTMVRHLSEQLDQVLELGEAMREAQEDLDAAQLRDLNRQRRQLVAAVVREGRKVAARLGQKVSEAAAEQTAATLQAAMADAGAANALRTGLLVEPMAAVGMDPVELAGVLAVPEALGEQAPRAPRGTAPRAARRAGKEDAAAALRAEIARAQEETQAAERSAATAERELRSAEDQAHRLEARALQLRSEVEELRRRLDEREHTLAGVEDRLDEAAEARQDAAVAHVEAQAAVEEARGKLERLRRK
ncbi:hypothetical protein [Georgenia daeguensis]|uniref:Transposase n=1 Tax=Georgenia daeguensis TaxID=908355 RepID=A0ABP8EV22_9MICO